MDPGNSGVRAFYRTFLGYAALAENVEFREFDDPVSAGRDLGLEGSCEAILERANWVEVDDGAGAGPD
jgi:hypothetical protein